MLFWQSNGGYAPFGAGDFNDMKDGKKTLGGSGSAKTGGPAAKL